MMRSFSIESFDCSFNARLSVNVPHSVATFNGSHVNIEPCAAFYTGKAAVDMAALQKCIDDIPSLIG